MSAVTMTYLFCGAETLHLSTTIAYPAGLVLAVLFLALFLFKAKRVMAGPGVPQNAARA
jgi:uncharacterized membrane protein YciS (DUF1049 family)